MLWFPEQRLGIALLSNFGSMDVSGIAYQVAEFYLCNQLAPRDVPMPKSLLSTNIVAADPTTLKIYAGRYQSEGSLLAEFAGIYSCPELDVRYAVTLKHGRLRMLPKRYDKVALEPVLRDEFRSYCL